MVGKIFFEKNQERSSPFLVNYERFFKGKMPKISSMVLHSYAPEWSYEETKEKLLAIPLEVARDFAITTYVTGSRLEEVRSNLRPKDISIIKISNGEDRIVVAGYTEKNPYLERRSIPINPLTEKHYTDVLLKIKYDFDPDIPPFMCFTGRYYQYKIRQYLDIHIHALRHLRVHHVDDNTIPGMKALTPRQFKDFFRWQKIETSAHYQSRTRSIDLAERM